MHSTCKVKLLSKRENLMSDQKVHAKLGASSAKRWLNCQGSLNFIASLPPFYLDDSSEFADEGTKAHELAEKHLRAGTDVEDKILDEPVQTYLDHVRSCLTPFGSLFIEHRFKINDEMFGTNDAIIIDEIEGLMQVFDYKHGVGVAVEAEENEQLMYYALGALKEFDPAGTRISRVTLTIVQPRCHHEDGPIRTWETTADRIRLFGFHLDLGAAATKDPNAPLVAGKHCRFCPALAVCPAYKKAVMEGMNSPALAESLKAAENLSTWKAALNRVAFKVLIGGRKIEGLKLVEKTKHRTWFDPMGLKVLLSNRPECFETDLKSPAQLEKIMGKEFVSAHATKGQSEPTIDLASSKKKEWTKGASDFADVEVEK